MEWTTSRLVHISQDVAFSAMQIKHYEGGTFSRRSTKKNKIKQMKGKETLRWPHNFLGYSIAVFSEWKARGPCHQEQFVDRGFLTKGDKFWISQHLQYAYLHPYVLVLALYFLSLCSRREYAIMTNQLLLECYHVPCFPNITLVPNI